MPKLPGAGLLIAVLLLFAACSDRGQLQIEHAWIGAVDPQGETTGFLEVSNPGAEPAHIVAADSEAFASVRLFAQQDGQMRQVKSLTIPARGSVQLDGDNGRLGLVGPRQPIHDGDHLPLALAVRLGDGQLLSLETTLHVHEDAKGDAHDHGHEHEDH